MTDGTSRPSIDTAVRLTRMLSWASVKLVNDAGHAGDAAHGLEDRSTLRS